MITTFKSTGLSLAGLGLDRDLLLRIGRTLLADLYWDDEREHAYRIQCQLHGHELRGSQTSRFRRNLLERPETPDCPDTEDALIRIAHICGRIEQEWGESFYSITQCGSGFDATQSKQEFDKALEDLLYHVLMGCIGHGIDAMDWTLGVFPDDLETSPIRIENPMLYQLSLL